MAQGWLMCGRYQFLLPFCYETIFVSELVLLYIFLILCSLNFTSVPWSGRDLAIFWRTDFASDVQTWAVSQSQLMASLYIMKLIRVTSRRWRLDAVFTIQKIQCKYCVSGWYTVLRFSGTSHFPLVVSLQQHLRFGHIVWKIITQFLLQSCTQLQYTVCNSMCFVIKNLQKIAQYSSFREN